MKNKLMAFAVAAFVTVLLASAVQAQKGSFVSFKGIEITRGHEEPDEVYGWMCYAKTTGALPGNLTLTMDYAGMPVPGTGTAITGGNWTLPVYGSSIKENSYMGVLYGTVVGGDVTLNKWGSTATIELKMLITGGTQSMMDMKGTAVLYGTVTYNRIDAPTFDGTIYFEFQ